MKNSSWKSNQKMTSWMSFLKPFSTLNSDHRYSKENSFFSVLAVITMSDWTLIGDVLICGLLDLVVGAEADIGSGCYSAFRLANGFNCRQVWLWLESMTVRSQWKMWFADFAEVSLLQLHLHWLVGACVAERADADSVDGITSPSLGKIIFQLEINLHAYGVLVWNMSCL